MPTRNWSQAVSNSMSDEPSAAAPSGTGSRGRPPRTSMLADLSFYIQHDASALDLSRPHAMRVFVKRLIANHYLMLSTFLQNSVETVQWKLSRQKDLTSFDVAAAEELWSDIQACERRMGEYHDDIEGTMVQLAGCPARPPRKPRPRRPRAGRRGYRCRLSVSAATVPAGWGARPRAGRRHLSTGRAGWKPRGRPRCGAVAEGGRAGSQAGAQPGGADGSRRGVSAAVVCPGDTEYGRAVSAWGRHVLGLLWRAAAADVGGVGVLILPVQGAVRFWRGCGGGVLVPHLGGRSESGLLQLTVWNARELLARAGRGWLAQGVSVPMWRCQP